MNARRENEVRTLIPMPPEGKKRLLWFGPGLLWMVSSVGSGAVLFTPRIGARYGYELLWAAFIVAFFMWLMIREVGRYSVVTGRTILEGYATLPGPKGWAIWALAVPQLVDAVAVIAGISALVGSVLMIDLPGGQALYAIGLLVLSTVLVVSGRYSRVEKTASFFAVLLVLAVGLAAWKVYKPGRGLAAGLIPSLPDDFDVAFALPWMGFLLAGAAGIVWFSYWVGARGFGGRLLDPTRKPSPTAKYRDTPEIRTRKLRSWLSTMSWTAAIGVAGGTLVIIAFLILGAELLGPKGVVPEGIKVAEDLTLLLSEVWGGFGHWIMVGGIFVALWSTIIADQDGWGRMLADSTRILKRLHGKPVKGDGERTKNLFIITWLSALPIVVFLVVRDPVKILAFGGIVTALHTPVVLFLTLAVNLRNLPPEHRPSRLTVAASLVALFFYIAVGGTFFWDLFRST